jgi:hypothetical protein
MLMANGAAFLNVYFLYVWRLTPSEPGAVDEDEGSGQEHESGYQPEDV